MRSHSLLTGLLSLWCVLLPVNAQSRGEANLKINVLDPSGAAIASARVQLDSGSLTPKTMQTGAGGEARFTQLAAGKYRVRVEAAGFEPYENHELTLKPGANQLEVKLQLAELKEEISVGQDKREANTDSRGNAFSTVLTEEAIAQLPDDPDLFEEAIQQMAGPGARLRVNGFGGGKMPPKSQIREIRFRTNPYAAENHEAGFISIDVFTKPGVNNWHGSFGGGFRDESLNARNAFAPFKGPEQDRRFNFDFSGPLWRNHTSLFVSGDGMNSYDTKTIVAALADRNFNDLIRRPTRRLNLQARLEHALTKTHTLRGEYQRNATRQDNLGVGNFDLAERAYTSDAAEHIFRLADSGAIGKHIFNELRFQTRWQDVGLRSLSQAQTIQVLDAFTSGGAQLSSDRSVREIELTDNIDLAFFKKHTLRAGLTFEAGRYDSSELRNANGTFTFASLADFRASRPLQFTRRSGSPAVTLNQYQFGWFIQDEWRVRKNFSLNFGVRHELQTNLDDKNNLAPRAGFAWSPFKDGKTTLRGGGGIFYDWFGAATYEQILRVNGQRQNDLIIRNPGFPDPFAGGTAITLPPSVIRRDAALQMPYVAQASIGVERELPRGMRLMTNYFYTRGLHQLRGININQPLPGLGRPDPTQGNITQIASVANSFTHALMFNLSWNNLPKRIFLAMNYRLSKTTNESDSPFSLPVDSYNLRAERGPASNDIRQMFFVMASFPIFRALRAGTTFNYLSAPPYTITTGFDNNGDAVINDRPAGIGRNSARGAAQVNTGLRLSWGFGFGKLKENAGGPQMQVRVVRGEPGDGMLGAMPSFGAANKRFRTEFYLQASNLLNHANLTNFIGVQSSPFFGQAIAALPGRRIETGMRFSF
ncbi:MAG TPA: TonB-dependent receptor [Blastocatellia bacterium]|nr:TonB-dependent receptor [Blastocatellia bacterium]